MIDEIQTAVRDETLDGWLFFDHHHRDPIAYRLLGIPESAHASRRWYYFVPAEGEPAKLVHRIESGILDSLPGSKCSYSSWTEQSSQLAAMLQGRKRIAMQYSPLCAIPYVSLVDGGTIELVRSLGVETVTSANLVQQFEARLSDKQFQSHIEAGKLVDEIRRDAFELVRQRLRISERVTEHEIQQFIRSRFAAFDLFSDHGPIVAVNEHSSDPHFEPTSERSTEIRRDDLLLIDLWAKKNEGQSVYYDITWTAYCGPSIPGRIQTVFEIVRDARKAACDFVSRAISAQQPIQGWQVDDVARNLIGASGFGEYFVHRTGHSIGTSVHGNGANMDNFESHDERRIVPDTCFSVEPGIYLPEFGIRSEVNMYVKATGASVSGEEQETLVSI